MSVAIIIGPHRDERLVCECCFVFTVYKALEQVFFSFVLNGNLGEALGEAGGSFTTEETEAQRIWLRPLHPLPHLHSGRKRGGKHPSRGWGPGEASSVPGGLPLHPLAHHTPLVSSGITQGIFASKPSPSASSIIC